MGALAKIKRALSLTCVIFTLVMTVMYLIGWLASDSRSLFVPTPSKALVILLFCAILGFASLLLSKEGTSFIRYAIHFVLCLASFILVFLIGGGFPLADSVSVIATVLYLLIYAVAMAVRGLICLRFRRRSDDNEEYTAVFK